ncbi:MAG: hydroxymyristoyl-ACP dehydratase [Gammaproteobacteria bacterium]|nr:hydroxymyristoyl-ACP dehydratase [Gammaproteobacteria bacterium]
MRFLFVDQILSRPNARQITGVKHITPDDPFLCKLDNTDAYCFIPSLIGETIGQLAAWAVMQEKNFEYRPVAGVVAEAVMKKPALLGQTLFLSCHIDALDDVAVQYHGSAAVNGEDIFIVKGAIGPLLPMQDFIDRDVVMAQFAEIDRQTSIENWSEFAADIPMHLPEIACYPMQYDAIAEIVPQKSCRAVKKISRSAAYFADHFPNKPVLPLTVLLECKRRLAEHFLMVSNWGHEYELVNMQRIKMSDFVQPGAVIHTELLLKHQSETELVLHLRTYTANKRVCVLDLVYKRKH